MVILMGETVDEHLWRECIDGRRSIRVLRYEEPEIIEPLALVRGKTSVFVHCRLIKGDGFTFRNFGLRCQFKQVDVLEPGSRSSHPWDWKVGSSPAPGVTVLYTGVNDPPVSGTSE
jgi:hypothetical protein